MPKISDKMISKILDIIPEVVYRNGNMAILKGAIYLKVAQEIREGDIGVHLAVSMSSDNGSYSEDLGEVFVEFGNEFVISTLFSVEFQQEY